MPRSAPDGCGWPVSSWPRAWCSSGSARLLGLGVAWALVRAAPLVLPATMPRVDDVAIDGRVVVFTAPPPW